MTRASDGSAVSDAVTVSITVWAANDAPTFAAGADQHITDLSGHQSIAGWATHISPGPADEAGQELHFVIVSDSNRGLFAVQPAIDAKGTLTFTPMEKISGSAQVT